VVVLSAGVRCVQLRVPLQQPYFALGQGYIQSAPGGPPQQFMPQAQQAPPAYGQVAPPVYSIVQQQQVEKTMMKQPLLAGQPAGYGTESS
jgi:hypothetical protein